MSKQDITSKSLDSLGLDPALQVAMKKVDVRWEFTDLRMDAFLKKLRLAGIIGNVTNENDIAKFVIPEDVKLKTVRGLIEKYRKEHLLERLDIIKKIQHADTDYTVEDVISLLAGKEVLREKRAVKLPFAPFMIFQ